MSFLCAFFDNLRKKIACRPKPRRILTILKILPAAVIAVACVLYLCHNLDTARFLRILGLLPLPAYPAFALIFACTALPQGLRLRLLLKNSCSPLLAVRAVFLGSGVNMILPARMGDLIKAVYLSINAGLSFPETLCAIFWERLSDLTTVLFLALVAGLWLNSPALYLSALILPAILICALVMVRLFQDFCRKCVSLLPWSTLRAHINSILTRLTDKKFRPAPGKILALSLLLWSAQVLCNSIVFAAFHQNASVPAAGLLLTVAGAIGAMIPGLPGNLGTFEASIVAALSLAGMNKSESLAFALILHLAQTAPAVLFAVYAALRGQWSLAEARKIFFQEEENLHE
ncbi:MAG: flippase-like domain-containing protein [Desulfovibrio sp.]|jgi:uncharacterized protein (TIRG00374 family)|nr:flippase-like domain-containing protein [Desulfovibrio sp.]